MLLQEAAVAAVSGEDVTEPQPEGMLAGSQGSSSTSGPPAGKNTGCQLLSHRQHHLVKDVNKDVNRRCLCFCKQGHQ